MSIMQGCSGAEPQESEACLDAGRRQGPHQAHGVADDLRTGRHRAVVSHPTAAVTLVGTPRSCHGHAPRRAWPSMAASVVRHKVMLTGE
jgi:hypothetical protein